MNNLAHIRSTECKRVDKFLGELVVAIASIHKVVSATTWIIVAWKEKKDMAVDMLNKVKKFYEQSRGRVACLRATEVREIEKKD